MWNQGICWLVKCAQTQPKSLAKATAVSDAKIFKAWKMYPVVFKVKLMIDFRLGTNVDVPINWFCRSWCLPYRTAISWDSQGTPYPTTPSQGPKALAVTCPFLWPLWHMTVVALLPNLGPALEGSAMWMMWIPLERMPGAQVSVLAVSGRVSAVNCEQLWEWWHFYPSLTQARDL